MKLGFVTAILPEQSFSEVLSVARAADFDCVEVMAWPPGEADRRYAGVTHIDVTQLTAARIQDVLDLTAELGVSISGLGYYPNLLSPDVAYQKMAETHLCKVIEGCAALGVPQCNTFIGRDWRLSVDDNWPRFLQVWRPLIAFAESHAVRIGIENCPMLFSSDEWPGGKNLAASPQIWRRMFDAIPSLHFGLNYDPSHLVWQQMDYLQPIQEFADRIFHVHAKDVQVNRARLNDVGILAYPPEYHVPKLPGLGDVRWGHFCSALHEIGYRGAVCVEVEDRSFEANTAARESALRQSARYLRNYITRVTPGEESASAIGKRA